MVSIRKRPGTYLFIIASLIVLILSVVYDIFGLLVTIKGGYVLMSIIVAYYIISLKNYNKLEKNISTKWCGIPVLIGLPISLIIHSRLVFVICMSFLSIMVLDRLKKRNYRHVVILCSSWLFLIVFSKFLFTGFYYGGSDTIIHVGYIQSVLQAGDYSAISGRYQDYPIFHIIVSIITLIIDTGAYPALMITGTVAFSTIPLMVYSAFSRVRSPEFSSQVATGSCLMAPIIYYGSYFYPMALSFYYVVIVSYLVISSAKSSQKREYSVLVLLVLFLLPITHHLSHIMMLSVLIPGILVMRIIPDRSYVTNRVFMLSLFVIYGLSLYYWVYTNTFVQAFLAAAADVVNQLQRLFIFSSTTSGARSVILLGEELSNSTIISTLLWYITFDGIYQIILTAIFIIGIIHIITQKRSSPEKVSLIGFALVTGFVVLKTPVVLPLQNRFMLLWSLPAAIMVGLGLNYLLSEHGYKKVGTIVFIMLFFVSAPLSMADDITGLRYDIVNEEKRNEFTDGEMASYSAVAEFTTHYETTTTSLRLQRSTIEYIFNGDTVDILNISNGKMTSRYPIYIQYNWNEYSHPANTDQFSGSLYISEEWLENKQNQNDKLYDNGKGFLSY